jgi:hypothetical protein
MTMIEQRLRELGELPASLPGDLARRTWATGRRQRRLRIRIGVGAMVLVAGAATSVVVAHPAFAETQQAGVVQSAASVGPLVSLASPTAR